MLDIGNMTSKQVAELTTELFYKDLLECFKEVFKEIARESMKDSIKQNVYAKYTPTLYERRMEQGGLIDDRNIIVDIYRDSTTGNIVGFVKNITTGVGKAYELIPIIESGKGYDWDMSKIAQSQLPRPFYEATITKIEASRWQNKVSRLLRARGWQQTK